MEEQDALPIESYVSLALQAKAAITEYPGAAFVVVRDAFMDVVNTVVSNILRYHLNKVKLELDLASWRTHEWEGHTTLLRVICGHSTLTIPVPVLKRVVTRKLYEKIGRIVMQTTKQSNVFHLFSVAELLTMEPPVGLRQALETSGLEEVVIWYNDIVFSTFLVQSVGGYSLTFSYKVLPEEMGFIDNLLAERNVAPFFYIEREGPRPISDPQKHALLRHGKSVKFVGISESNLGYQVMRQLGEYPDVNAYFGWKAIYAHPESSRMYLVNYDGNFSQPWADWPKANRYGLSYADFGDGPDENAFFIVDSERGMDRVSGSFPMTKDKGWENILRIVRLWNEKGPEFVYRHLLSTLRNLDGPGVDWEYVKLLVRSFYANDQTFLNLTVLNELVAIDDKGELYLWSHHNFAFVLSGGWWKSSSREWVHLLSSSDFAFDMPTGSYSYVPLLVLVASGDVTVADAAKYLALTKGIQVVKSLADGYGYYPRYKFSGETSVFEFFG